MLLEWCKFVDLAGFGTLVLDDLRHVTTFIGPNGAGKSTLLRVLHLAFRIASARTIRDELSAVDGWDLFSSAHLRFRNANPRPLTILTEYLGTSCTVVEFEIRCADGTFMVHAIRCDGRELRFSSNGVPTRHDLQQRETAIEELREQHRKEQQSFQAVAPNQKAAHQARIESLATNLKRKQADFDSAQPITAGTEVSDLKVVLTRQAVDGLLAELAPAPPVHVPPRQSPETSIPTLISELMKLRKGRRKDQDTCAREIKRLSHLLQADVDVSEVQGKEALHINGVPYQRASSGTETTLAFFSMTWLGHPSCTVIWDEPENGLHPTRRCRLLDLMFADDRQYILASHASEMAPVFSSNGRVFRCESKYDADGSKVALAVDSVVDRRDAFSAVEALGVHPARTLFTANVVLWVEGPTELLFYRHWLRRRLLKRNIHEGFHYTLMQYGGGLISYIEANDDCNFSSLFDLLSMCRNPVILLDSDFRCDGAEDRPLEHLKAGAKRLLGEIDVLNARRANSAIMRWTGGREIENYLPPHAIAFAVHELSQAVLPYREVLALDAIEYPRYASCHDVIWKRLVECGATDDNDSSKPRGRTRWGTSNKVEFMRVALSTPDLVETQLRWDASALLADLEDFVVRHSGDES